MWTGMVLASLFWLLVHLSVMTFCALASEKEVRVIPKEALLWYFLFIFIGSLIGGSLDLTLTLTRSY